MAVSKNEVWTVVGVGMGGKGLLADLGLNGFRLRAYDKDDAQVAGIRAAGGIYVDGRDKNFGPGRDGDDRHNGSPRWRQGDPCFDQWRRSSASRRSDLAPHLRDGQIIVLIQGHFAGTLVVPQGAVRSGLQGEGRCLRDGRLPVHDDGARTGPRRADLDQGGLPARRRCRRRARRNCQGDRPRVSGA